MIADVNLVSLIARYGNEEKCREALEKILAACGRGPVYAPIAAIARAALKKPQP